MKKYILSLMALVATMSINAQVIKVYKNGGAEPVATYTNTTTNKYKVVFEEYVDPNLLSGEFTVRAAEGENPAKKVKFTKGNLQATYNGSNYTWGFAANQWDYIGGKNSDGNGTETGNNTIGSSQTDNAVVDLFGWSGSDASHYGISASNSGTDYSGSTLKDWGGLFSDKNFSTLSKNEWTYLLNTSNVTSGARTQTNRYAKATVHSTQGLLIFPDNYSGTTAGIESSNMNNTSTTTFSTISDDTWTTMESAGVVFLPAAGFRFGSNVIDAGAFGGYWSSTTSDKRDYVYYWYFNSSKNLANDGSRSFGYSVRLVSVVSE